MKILFVRHGESIDDIEDRYGGWADFDLTEKGTQQATNLAGNISLLKEKFEVILTSPLKRALQTAEIIGEQLKVDVEVLAYLKERNLNGILSGMTRTDAQQKYPILVERHDQWQYIDGSERTEDFNNRVKTCINLILNMRYSSMIVVTHGLFLKTLFKEFLKENLVSIGDAAFILVEFVNDKPTILQTHAVEIG